MSLERNNSKMDSKTVKDIMTKEVIMVSSETSLFDAAKVLYKNRFNGLPVVDKDNVLVGILTEYDLLNIDSMIHIPTLQNILGQINLENTEVKKEFETIAILKVGGVMNNDPLTLLDSATLEETVATFVEHHRVNPIPVIDFKRKVIGIVSRSDLIKFFTAFPSRPTEIQSSSPRLVDTAVNALMKESISLLEQRMALLQSTVASSNQPILITDPDEKILYTNQAWEKLSGYSTKEILGKHPNDLWGGHMPKEFYEKMWQTVKTEKKPFVGEVKNVKKDGTEYWQEDYVTPILDQNGNIKFFIFIEPDITARKQKDQFREEFISIIGHQLRNPLVGIKWMIELLAESSTITDADKHKIEEIYKENKGLSSFVEDLLILSRIGKKDLTREAIDLKSEIKIIIKEVKTANQQVDFSFNIIGDVFPLTTNRPMAIQVFENLIYNAAEYSDKTSGKVAVVLEKKDSSYLFSVHNNGPEISEEDKPKIFSKFFRSGEAQEMKKSGTGLGPFITQAICDNFGWGLTFESGSGQGTTFYVKIQIINK